MRVLNLTGKMLDHTRWVTVVTTTDHMDAFHEAIKEGDVDRLSALMLHHRIDRLAFDSIEDVPNALVSAWPSAYIVIN